MLQISKNITYKNHTSICRNIYETCEIECRAVRRLIVSHESEKAMAQDNRTRKTGPKGRKRWEWNLHLRKSNYVYFLCSPDCIKSYNKKLNFFKRTRYKSLYSWILIKSTELTFHFESTLGTWKLINYIHILLTRADRLPITHNREEINGVKSTNYHQSFSYPK